MKIIDKVKRVVRGILRDGNCPTLEITTVFPCVNSCRFCPQDKWRKAYTGKPRLTYEEFCTILAKVPKDVRIDFSGFSEPFANRESSRMMRHAYEQGYQVALFTTLIGFRQEDLDLIKDIRFSGCNIHIPDDTNFRVVDEDKWLATYKLFAKHIRYNDAVYHHGNLSAKLQREVARARVYPILTRANTVDPEVAPPLPRHTGTISCSTSKDFFNQNVIMPNGDVYLCCMDWSLQHKLGNLFKQSYEELHQSEEYQKICRSMHDESIETICRYCERSVTKDILL